MWQIQIQKITQKVRFLKIYIVFLPKKKTLGYFGPLQDGKQTCHKNSNREYDGNGK